HARFFEQADALAEVSDGDPVEIRAVPFGGVGELGECLFLRGNDRDVVALRPRGFQHEEREAAVSCDQPQLHCRMAEWQNGRMDLLQFCNSMSLICHDLLSPARGTAEDHATL